jgi:hypothetical protein
MESLYLRTAHLLFQVFYGPLILLCRAYLALSYRFQCWYLERYELRPFLKVLFRLDTYFFVETLQIPNTYLAWMLPDWDKTKDETIMVKAIDTSKSHEYVTKTDQKLPREDQTIFLVRFLSAQQQFEMRDDMYQVTGIAKGRKEKFMTGTNERKTLNIGLVGWKNLSSESGNDISFDAKDMPKMLDFLPPDVRTELAQHIRGESELEEGEG